ncbi:uncharacterized protein LOC131804003 [Musca domestica]|uniref:Uncharacterized protein LOC131804003 n=1 Tax=Musca domestica TaxID=7370 RepID=A0ABM3V8J0_MUSDO|nr:uncharacterized protein LOC131804003 [Musca domestica]
MNDGQVMLRNDCNMIALPMNRFIVNETLEFSQDMGEKIQLRFVVLYKIPIASKELPFLNVSMGLCELLESKMSSVLMRSVVDELRKSSNLPYACPMKKNYIYKLENFTLTESLLPPYIPIVNFKFSVEMFENGRSLGYLKTQGATIKRT